MSYLRHRAARRRPHVPHLRHEANRPAAGAAENMQNNPKIFSKTRVVSFIIVMIFLIIGLWRVFLQ